MKNLWDKIAAFEDKEIGAGASEREIQQVEAEVKMRIRGGYREFLKRYSWARFAHEQVLGVGDRLESHRTVASTTRWEREDAEPPLQKALLPVMADGAGNHYCVDLADERKLEPPVVFWDHEQGATSPACASFAEWLSALLDDLQNRPRIEIDTTL